VELGVHHAASCVMYVKTLSIYFACFYCIMKSGIIFWGEGSDLSYSKKKFYLCKGTL
jgi:hypothetical protein